MPQITVRKVAPRWGNLPYFVLAESVWTHESASWGLTQEALYS